MASDVGGRARLEADRQLKTPGRTWPRLALKAIAVVVLATAWVAVYGQADAGQPPSGVAPVVLGPDGIPNQVDGQRVFRVGERAQWQMAIGSFLLGGWSYPALSMHLPPPAGQGWSPEVEGRLLGGATPLWPYPPNKAGYSTSGEPLLLALNGSGAMGAWFGDLVVVRVHTHDVLAAACPAAVRSSCEAAAVFEEVVWPVVPRAVDGERVYRAVDSETYEKLDGSFLFGGPVSVLASSEPSCDPTTGRTAAEQRFVVFCDWTAIDGLTVAPGSAFTALDGSLVVVRAHVHDPLASQCPDYMVSDCERTIVVDAVVGAYLPYSADYARPALGGAKAPGTLGDATYPFGAARAS